MDEHPCYFLFLVSEWKQSQIKKLGGQVYFEVRGELNIEMGILR